MKTKHVPTLADDLKAYAAFLKSMEGGEQRAVPTDVQKDAMTRLQIILSALERKDLSHALVNLRQPAWRAEFYTKEESAWRQQLKDLAGQLHAIQQVITDWSGLSTLQEQITHTTR